MKVKVFYVLLLGLTIIGFASKSEASSLTADFAFARATERGNLALRRIEIDSRFQGMKMLLFGARHDAGDVVVVIRGPELSYVVRRKDRIAGIWVNREEQRFDGVHGYYALSSSVPLTDIGNDYLLKSLGINPYTISRTNLTNQPQIESHTLVNLEEDKVQDPFTKALLDKGYKKRLYSPKIGKIQFIGDTLFRTIIDFPESIPRGQYNAEVYLFREGLLIGMEVIPLVVKKRGFDAFIFDLAYTYPALYGILAVSCALFAGWAAGSIFRRAKY